MDYLLAIPVYNEEKSIEPLIKETLEHLSGRVEKLLLINDGSSDNSGHIIKQFSEKYREIVLIENQKNRGYGAVLVQAMEYGCENDFDFLITMDCDLQHRPDDLIRFLEYDQDLDVVSGSRYLPDSSEHGTPPIDRVEINRKITDKLNRIYRWRLTDAFCGFKRYALKSLNFDLFQETGYSFPLEFWAYSFYSGLKIEEISVSRIYTTDNRSFGEDLDFKRKRYKYYLKTLTLADHRFRRLSEIPSSRTGTISGIN